MGGVRGQRSSPSSFTGAKPLIVSLDSGLRRAKRELSLILLHHGHDVSTKEGELTPGIMGAPGRRGGRVWEGRVMQQTNETSGGFTD